jgi:ectoine hydroxylase-related dioxygenase (phytanoyl-CoA dioxygenase family)
MTPHPLSAGFHWTDSPVSDGPLSAADIAQYDRLGYVVARAVLPRSVVDEVRMAIDDWEARTEDFLLRQPGGEMFIASAGQITFTVHIARRDAVAAAFVEHPALRGVARQLLGEDTTLYWDQAVYKKPEPNRVFPWHQDNGYAFVEPQQYLTCWVPLTPATVHNGCPRVAPGLHRCGTLQHWAEPWGLTCLETVDAVQVAEADPGDVVVFSSLTPHMTGPNRTAEVRKSYIVQYCHAGAEVVAADGTRTPITERVLL